MHGNKLLEIIKSYYQRCKKADIKEGESNLHRAAKFFCLTTCSTEITDWKVIELCDSCKNVLRNTSHMKTQCGELWYHDMDENMEISDQVWRCTVDIKI